MMRILPSHRDTIFCTACESSASRHDWKREELEFKLGASPSSSHTRDKARNDMTHLEIRCMTHHHPPRPRALQHPIHGRADFILRCERPTAIPVRTSCIIQRMFVLRRVGRQTRVRIRRVRQDRVSRLQLVQQTVTQRVDRAREGRQVLVVRREAAVDEAVRCVAERRGEK